MLHLNSTLPGPSARAVTAGFLAFVLLLSGPSQAKAAGTTREADRLEADRIVRRDLIPHYLTKQGFNVAPQKIDYDNYPKLEPLLERWPTLWKSVQATIAEEYEKRQREVNDKNRPNARKWRKILKDSFDEACSLRGGGSMTAELYTYSGAYSEWLISQYHPVSDPYLSDDEIAKKLKKDFEGLSRADLASFQKVATHLSGLDRFLAKPEAAFIRKEFVAYFNLDD